MDDWCAAHGWDSKEIVSGTVNVYAYCDGHAEVTAEIARLRPQRQARSRRDEDQNANRRRHGRHVRKELAKAQEVNRP
jgi:prepilin-type processing-associated H-X9-DG protein